MKTFKIFIIILLSFSQLKAQNSISKVIVETYYISDSIDATDTIGGHLFSGSTTYRIYLKMKPGCKLKKIYGDSRHALKISSTENFFNNADRGKTFAKDISKTNYKNNTTALDTWLTIGQTTKTSTLTCFGILKTEDTDGSFVGGANNDGGSESISSGLLINNNPQAGTALTIADGMDTMNLVPTGWSDNGFVDIISGADSTIFGSLKKGKEFTSNSSCLQNSGVSGVLADSNEVLMAQLTTKGNISFEFNVEVMEPDGTTTKYVASGKDTLDEKFCAWLKYPISCGCMDPNYFEYSSEYLCNISDSCKTKIIIGCMDVNACNYDANANFNVQTLCCYPGQCGNRDISKVCPQLSEEIFKKMIVYPNPVQEQINIELHSLNDQQGKIVIIDTYSKVKIVKDVEAKAGKNYIEISTSGLPQGIYFIQFLSGNEIIEQTFIKL